jgi:hypothetical protein
MIPISYTRKEPEKPPVKKKHAIHKAIRWQKMLDNGIAESRSEIARIEGLTPARVTQVMYLLKLPNGVKDFLAGLDNPKEIRKYSERKLQKGSIKIETQPDGLEQSWVKRLSPEELKTSAFHEAGLLLCFLLINA